jgi:hypothetical protein
MGTTRGHAPPENFENQLSQIGWKCTCHTVQHLLHHSIVYCIDIRWMYLYLYSTDKHSFYWLEFSSDSNKFWDRWTRGPILFPPLAWRYTKRENHSKILVVTERIGVDETQLSCPGQTRTRVAWELTRVEWILPRARSGNSHHNLNQLMRAHWSRARVTTSCHQLSSTLINFNPRLLMTKASGGT